MMNLKGGEKIENRIHDFITKKGGGVSFIEIGNEFGEGEYEYGIGKTNIIFWVNLPLIVAEALTKLRAEKRVLIYPTHPLLYLADGGGLTLPLANRVPKNGYKDPHWLPVVLWTIEQIKDGMKTGTLLTDPKKAAIYRDNGYDI